ncbi:MAG TPA: YfhO family protein [Gemmatimonadaceae bacterium]|nr:YfhO family protein [Gemmatimonadaceae bacterium]
MTTYASPSDEFEPRYPLAWATLACVLAALTLSYPALSGQFLVNPLSDQYIAGYSFREFAAASLRAGNGFPLWNPYLLGGMPYVAAMHGDIFYPTFLLRMVLPTDIAMTWGMITHLILSGVATYAFLRTIGIGFFGAVVGGIAYMMGGQVSSLASAGHDGKLFVSALFPVTLLVLTWGIRDGRRWAWGLLAVVIGLGVLSPHPQLLQYLLLASGAWALMLAFGGAGDTALTRREAFTRLGLALGAVVIGFAMGAIQYLPVSEYVEWSPRVGGRDYAYATSYSMPIEELFNTYLPQFTGTLTGYWGRNGIHFHSEYIGAAVLFLAAGAFARGATPFARRMLWFWVGLGFVSLIWALGGNTPFYHLVYNIVPGSKFFRAPSTIFFVTTFAVAVLAALGTERALAGARATARAVAPTNVRRWGITGLAVGGGIALLASVGALQQVALNIALPGRLELVDANAGALIAGAWRSFLFLAAAVAVVYAVSERRITPVVAGWALAAVVVVDLWSVERQYFGFMAPASELYASDPGIEHMKQETQPFRVIAEPLVYGSAFHDPMLSYDGLMLHGIRIPYGYHGNEIRYWRGLAERSNAYDSMSNPTFWGLANVKYFYTNVDSLPVPGARRVVGPFTNAAGSTISLFELAEPHPFAWVAPAIAKYPDESVVQALRAPGFPYRSVALIDTASTTPAVTLSALPSPLDLPVTATSYEPGHFTLELAAPAPEGSALVVSENYYPGWTATVDGQPAKAERANLALMAVALPAGAQRVEFTFDSAPFHTGKMVTLIALALALLALAAGVLLQRRHGGGAAEASRA